VDLHDDDGAIGHAEMRIGDSVVMMFDSRREPHTESRTAWFSGWVPVNG
jgi:uncharacterized glyoxalase superfamily protein PhnB